MNDEDLDMVNEVVQDTVDEEASNVTNKFALNKVCKNDEIEQDVPFSARKEKWYKDERVAYYASIGFALICCIVGILFSKDASNVPDESPVVDENVSLEEFNRVVFETVTALREKVDEVNREKALHLAKVTDLLQKELGEYDKQAQADAEVRLESLSLETLKTEYSTFLKDVQEKGMTKDELKEVKFREWAESNRRTILYQEYVKTQLGALTENIEQALIEDPKVKILKVLHNSGMAFLVTFERPWRVYLQKDINSRKMSMLLAGRVVIGYDMRKIKFNIIEGLPGVKTKYRIKLPAPEIKDVVFDFDKTHLVRMSEDGGDGVIEQGLAHLKSGWYGMSSFFKEICAQTPENKKVFLDSFYRNDLFDIKEVQDNIVNVLRPYFELQGNDVVFDPTNTTFPNMMNEFLNKSQYQNYQFGGAR